MDLLACNFNCSYLFKGHMMPKLGCKPAGYDAIAYYALSLLASLGGFFSVHKTTLWLACQ